MTYPINRRILLTMQEENRLKVTQEYMDSTLTVDEAVVLKRRPRSPFEELAGLTPLQLLLASLAGCSANTLMAVLVRRMQQPVRGMEVHAKGQRRDDHPTVLTAIKLEFELRGAGIDPAAVERALKVAKEQLCPVWVMLKAGTPITASYRIFEG